MAEKLAETFREFALKHPYMRAQDKCFAGVARGKGINLECRDDWMPWYEMFCAGMDSVDDSAEYEDEEL